MEFYLEHTALSYYAQYEKFLFLNWCLWSHYCEFEERNKYISNEMELFQCKWTKTSFIIAEGTLNDIVITVLISIYAAPFLVKYIDYIPLRALTVTVLLIFYFDKCTIAFPGERKLRVFSHFPLLISLTISCIICILLTVFNLESVNSKASISLTEIGKKSWIEFPNPRGFT